MDIGRGRPNVDEIFGLGGFMPVQLLHWLRRLQIKLNLNKTPQITFDFWQQGKNRAPGGKAEYLREKALADRIHSTDSSLILKIGRLPNKVQCKLGP